MGKLKPLFESRDFPTEEKQSRFSVDDRLRENGFTIHSRPKKGETLWQRNGKVYQQSQALNLC